MLTFKELGLSDRIVERLNEQGMTEPTPIQEKAIPLVLQGRDVMGLAQTGTGKTAAFGLPMVHLMAAAGRKPNPKTARGLILAPTRELAGQITDAIRPFIEKTHLKIGVVVGGQSINVQVKRLERGLDILVATPGRLLDLIDRRALTLAETEFLVLDEADQMLDLGFVHALRKIAAMLPAERQTMLFSATMAKQMAEIAAAYLNKPVRVEVSPPGKAADKIAQSVIFVPQARKAEVLKEKLDAHRDELALVFSRTKHGAEKLMKSLEAVGFAAGSIHGNKSQGQRDRALRAFREGKLRVLVATDVAARGIDIPEVRHVYNFDLPNVPENYVHRIGRTARAGAEGSAIAFCAPAEMGELRAIEKTMGLRIPVAEGTPWEHEEPAGGSKNKGRRHGGPGKPQGQGQHRRGGKPQGNKRYSQAA
ncbi:DEAD/DEAH box helicase [Albidovulum sp.]|uniref:DEAD/DEAH box helicase n=1 Tax=Albidovulum sp. TaxID=1872424 RepID=UPI003D7C8DE6